MPTSQDKSRLDSNLQQSDRSHHRPFKLPGLSPITISGRENVGGSKEGAFKEGRADLGAAQLCHTRGFRKLKETHTELAEKRTPFPQGRLLSGVGCGWRALLLLAFALAGCHTVRPFAPVNLQEPGWHVREGQAVWRPKREAAEIAGEILLATKPDGQVFIQFSKNPFPLLVAQATGDKWQIELPIEKKRYSGHGQPPRRLIWLYLSRVLSGQPPPKGWAYTRLESSGWKLENDSTGEALEGYLNP